VYKFIYLFLFIYLLFIYLLLFIHAFRYMPQCFYVIRELCACDPHSMRKYGPTGIFTTVFIADNNSSSNLA